MNGGSERAAVGPGPASTARGAGRWGHGSAGLPVAASSLVGREQERAEVAGLVAKTRLVTLTGSGGCGKTRLALEVAHDAAPRFEHGVCWVELSRSHQPTPMPRLCTAETLSSAWRSHAWIVLCGGEMDT